MSLQTYYIGLVNSGTITAEDYTPKVIWVNMIFPFVGSILGAFVYKISARFDRDETKIKN